MELICALGALHGVIPSEARNLTLDASVTHDGLCAPQPYERSFGRRGDLRMTAFFHVDLSLEFVSTVCAENKFELQEH
jgi:hypothetical protein